MGYFTGRLPLALIAGPFDPGAGPCGAVEGPAAVRRGPWPPSTPRGDVAIGDSRIRRRPRQLEASGRLPQPLFDIDKTRLALSDGQLAEAKRQHCKRCGGGVVAARIKLKLDAAVLKIGHAA